MQVAGSRRTDAKLGRLSVLAPMRHCSRSALRYVSSICDEVVAPAGHVLVHEGGRGPWLFLIEHGSADVVKGGRRLGSLGPGQWVGDIAALDGVPEPYTVRAHSGMSLFVMDQRVVPRLREVAPVALTRPASDAGVSPARAPEAPAAAALPRRTRRRWPAGVAAALCAVLVFAALYHPPLATIAPGPTHDITQDVTVTGVPTYGVSGRYLMTTASVGRPTILGAMGAFVRPGVDLVSLGRVMPRGADPDELRQEQQRLFAESRLVAAVAAARAVGLQAAVRGTGAVVAAVAAGRPAAGVLRQGDVVVAVEGRPVGTDREALDALASRASAARLRMTVERDGQPQEVVLAAARIEETSSSIEAEPSGAIGVRFATRNLRADLPFRVTFAGRDVGGQSAGLAYAIVVADMLTAEDESAGRTIAVTGAIDEFGRVEGVGGVEQKRRAAERSHAQLMVVPDHRAPASPPGLIVWPAASLRDLMGWLRSI